jgi:hypothetical protein
MFAVHLMLLIGASASLHAAAPREFSYNSGIGEAVRVYQVELGAFNDTVYAYATFQSDDPNPAPDIQGKSRGVQMVTLGWLSEGAFTPAVRFGLNNDGRAPEGQGHLAPWAEDGSWVQFGPHARPQTPCDFKITVDIAGQSATISYAARGDLDWFVFSERAPLLNKIKTINCARIELNPGAAPVCDFVAQQTRWAEGENLRSHPLAKKNRVVSPDAGYACPTMRSLWRKPGRHVTIARNPKRWMGFPDVAQTGPESLVCAYADGSGHGAGGGLFVRRSSDLGRTWSDPITVLEKSVDAPRLQRLSNGSLLALAELYDVGPLDTVLFDSNDGGKTWANKRFCHAKDAGGNLSCVPSRICELPDGSWLFGASWYPGGKAWEGAEGECLEFYRSTDRGNTWQFWSRLTPAPPHSLSEPSILVLPDKRLLLYAREGWGGLPGVKAYSSDNGKTWTCTELPFPIVGRTCAGFLDDGRVMMTFRSQVGRAALWAWVGDALDDTPCRIWGAHFNDARSVGLKDGELHIDNDGLCGQFTQYFLRSPDGPEGSIEFTAEVKVVENAGCAATCSIPFAGKLRMFPDHVEMAHDPALKAAVAPGMFHVYRIVCKSGQMTLDIDGATAFTTDKMDKRSERIPCTPVTASVYALAFGNERDGDASGTKNLLSSSTDITPDAITPRVTGHSIWRNIRAVLDHPASGKHITDWNAASGQFPDQYQLDHITEIDASATGHDQGYSGWFQLENEAGAKTDKIFVTAYTDDTAPVCEATHGGFTMGVAWIRGTFLTKEDLSPRK